MKKGSTIESILFVLHLTLSCYASRSSADAVCTTATMLMKFNSDQIWQFSFVFKHMLSRVVKLIVTWLLLTLS